ncbi:hypothetical protein [Natronosalvus caseinilyticus]|uniref:hypothetical protein n=1 Tax=Natronosalvus caseinilyticus TaxID=2953747 RepID=UPI0028A58730|nr:hypothetical protein [Natronosalvus caseinilyticus]
MNTTVWDDCTWLCPQCEADRDEGEPHAILELVASGNPSRDVAGPEMRDDEGALDSEK